MPIRNHTEKLEESITREAAMFFEREGNRQALITVTRTVLTKRGNGATLFISVFPPEKEKAAMDFINRNLGELRSALREKIKSRAIPTLRIVPDYGERTRDEINKLLKE
ncbi:MAG: ribosome-binding factor A [Candidatus Pacebacteria bacterium]|nr:ribosome-binding factor A [Candidatus Paceibacterota bacterium]